ncbi:response regulator [Glutamicibacter soli]|uniref:response regulator n=1 Tax=Glutamicibacter soli TaxID=453836 RepID=UPI00192996DE|nr:response regulator transcription factor [Glutamicibacter soli]
MIRILLADDHPVFRRGLELVLSGIADFQVCAIAENGEQAVELAAMHRPEVVIMDLRMPLVDGIGATGRIVSRNPAPAVLVLSMFGDGELVLAALRAGARGYLLKGAGEEQIERAVRAVAAGEAIFDAQIATRVLAQFDQAVDPAVSALPMLTERELQVLRLLDQGLGNAAIAAELGVALKTVRNHVSNILAKLQARDRHEAVQRLHPHSDGEY